MATCPKLMAANEPEIGCWQPSARPVAGTLRVSTDSRRGWRPFTRGEQRPMVIQMRSSLWSAVQVWSKTPASGV